MMIRSCEWCQERFDVQLKNIISYSKIMNKEIFFCTHACRIIYFDFTKYYQLSL